MRWIARRERMGVVGLIIAGVVVAIAILLEGAPSRAVNGVGALLWLGSTAILVRDVARGPRWWIAGAVTLAVTVALSTLVEPTSLAAAVPGFAIGGLIVALLTPRPLGWAVLVAGLWLPVHLLTAVAPAIIRATSGGSAAVRTDPPPTAAVVPLAMILAAGAAGLAVGSWRSRRAQTAMIGPVQGSLGD